MNNFFLTRKGKVFTYITYSQKPRQSVATAFMHKIISERTYGISAFPTGNTLAVDEKPIGLDFQDMIKYQKSGTRTFGTLI